MVIETNAMYKEEPTKGIDFYSLLEKSEEFTSELGKVALASGKLEVELIILLEQNDVKVDYSRATLGSLRSQAEKNKLLRTNMLEALKLVMNQRNYLTHNIYALFSGQIDETILPKNDLLDSDIETYIEKVIELKVSIHSLVDVIKMRGYEVIKKA